MFCHLWLGFWLVTWLLACDLAFDLWLGFWLIKAFDLFHMLNMLSLHAARLAVHFDVTL